MLGLAWAMHAAKEARPSRDCAIWESVSPGRTVNFVVVRTDEIEVGRTICEPATMWLGSRMSGLEESRSCQRTPRPRCCWASFQSESPRFTVTTVGTTSRFAGFKGAMVGATGAEGCAGAKRAAGGRDGAIIGGAAVKILGRANGECFTGGR